MKLMIRTNSDDEHYNADCDYAVVDITEELAKKIAARRKLLLEMHEKDTDLTHLHYNSTGVTFYTTVDNDDCEDERFYDLMENVFGNCEDFVELPADLDVEFLDEATPDDPYHDFRYRRALSDGLIIYPNMFSWIFYGEGCTVETALLSYDILSKLI